MYIPLQLRLTLFYTLILAIALWFFGQTVYAQAEQRAYADLNTILSSRAASVKLGKFLASPGSLPTVLPSVDGLGTGGVSIEVLNDKMSLLAATANNTNDFTNPTVDNLGSSLVPWDSQAARTALQRFDPSITPNGFYSTIKGNISASIHWQMEILAASISFRRHGQNKISNNRLLTYAYFSCKVVH